MINLCAPAIIYLIFSITQILIDTYNGLYNTAMVKGIVAVMVTLLLNILCEKGLSVVSWIIVFIPFILMTVIVTMILYVFGLDVATGNNSYKDTTILSTSKDTSGNLIVYDPQYNAIAAPVYYKYPNVVVPNPNNTNNVTANTSTQTNVVIVPTGTSSPAYQS